MPPHGLTPLEGPVRGMGLAACQAPFVAIRAFFHDGDERSWLLLQAIIGSLAG